MRGNPGREVSSTSRGHRVTVFSWVDIFLGIFLGTNSEKLTKPREVFQMLAWKYLDFIPTKQI